MPKIIQSEIAKNKKDELRTSIAAFEGKKVLIIGDIGVDEYVLGQVRRISPEAPVPVLDVDSVDLRLGLSANVAQNVASLGGQAFLVSVVGADGAGDQFKSLCQKYHISTRGLVQDPQRPTTRKTRVMAKHHHLVRVDYEVRRFLSPEVEVKVLENIQQTMSQTDIVVLQDYAKGLISPSLTTKIVELANAHGKRILADPHRNTPLEFYKGVHLIKPNFDEAIALTGVNFDDLRFTQEKVYDLGPLIQKKTSAREVVITRGKDGMLIFSNGTIIQVPTFARQVFDVTGAGDTVIATLALGLAAEFTLEKACVMANFAAGVVVGKVGCVPCEIGELSEYIQEHSHSFE